MPRRNFYQAVICNLDGLLLNTERITCDAWKRAGGELGYPMSEPLVRTLIGMSPRDTEIFLRKIYGREFPFEKVLMRMTMMRDAYASHWGIPIKRGARDMLNLLNTLMIAKAVVSSTECCVASEWLIKSQFSQYFNAAVCGDEIVNGKPSPDLYVIAAQRLGVAAEKCLVLESSDIGVRAAHAAGMTVVMVPNLQAPSPKVLQYIYRIESSLAHLADELPELLTSTIDVQQSTTQPSQESQSMGVH